MRPYAGAVLNEIFSGLETPLAIDLHDQDPRALGITLPLGLRGLGDQPLDDLADTETLVGIATDEDQPRALASPGQWQLLGIPRHDEGQTILGKPIQINALENTTTPLIRRENPDRFGLRALPMPAVET